MAYRAFATIRMAIAHRVHRKRFVTEISYRVGPGANGKTLLSYNLDDYPADDSDMHEAHRLNEVSTRDLPRDGRIWVYVNQSWDGDGICDLILTLKDAQVVAIEGQPWQAPPPPPKKVKPARHVEAEALVRATVKRLLASLRRSKVFAWNGEHEPRVRISFHPSRRRSRGGEKGINLALRHWVRDGDLTLLEYAHYRRDPEIGKITGPWQTIVKVVVAHELAHWALESWCVKKPEDLKDRISHGRAFQEIYRYLRRKALEKPHDQP